MIRPGACATSAMFAPLPIGIELNLIERVAMPANNLSLVFARAR